MADGLTVDAKNVLTLVKELDVLDRDSLLTLQQLFLNRVSDDLLHSLLSGKEEQVAIALFAVTTNVSAAGPLGYTLRFLCDLCTVSAKLVAVFARPDASTVFGQDPCGRFLDFADIWSAEAGITRPALILAGNILRLTPKGYRDDSVAAFLQAISRVIAAADYGLCRDLEHVVHATALFVKSKPLKSRFREAKLVQHLPRLLAYVCGSIDSSAMVQLLYEVLLVCWVLSYDYQCLAVLAKEKLLAVVHKALQRSVKEKCTRLCILILKNFSVAQQAFNAYGKGVGAWTDPSIDALMTSEATVRPPTYFSDMIGIGLLKTLWQLQRKKFGDEDISTEVEALIQTLEANLDDLTSFSEYKGEVDSKVLEWSPVHSSAKFWKENHRLFEKNNYEVLINLCALLDSKSEITVAVACHDIGELVRHHPNGRLLLQIPALNNPKAKIMQLMSHPQPEIARNALLAVQKIMVQRWEFLQ